MSDAAAATDLAVRYQIMSPHTNYVVVDARAEHDKAGDLPALRKVPQTLAAGWHGIAAFGDASIDTHYLAQMNPAFSRRSLRMCMSLAPLPFNGVDAPPAPPHATRLLDVLLADGDEMLVGEPQEVPRTLSGLRRLGVSKAALKRLRSLVDEGVEEALVVLAFLSGLAWHARRQYGLSGQPGEIRQTLREVGCPPRVRRAAARAAALWLAEGGGGTA
jgi:Ca-activated chloride channel family protein